MARCGIHRRLTPDGRRIAMEAGIMLGLGDGHGSDTSHGASRHTTMAVGRLLAAAGAGALVLIMRGRFMAQHLLASSVGALA